MTNGTSIPRYGTPPYTLRPTQQRRSIAPSVPQQRDGYFTPITPAPKDMSQPNNQIIQDVLVQARDMGVTQNELNAINTRLQTGAFEVANIDPAKALNIQEKRQEKGSQELNTLLNAALDELNDVQSEHEKRIKLSHLAMHGEVPDYDAASDTYVTFDAAVNSKTDGVEAVTILQNMTTLDTQNRATTTQREVNPKEIDSLAGDHFDVLKVDDAHKQGALSTDQKHLAALRQTLNSPEFKAALDQGVSKLNTLDAPMLQRVLAPLQVMLSEAYGMGPIGIDIQPKSPDGGTTLALYNPENAKVTLFVPGIQALVGQGRQKCINGDQNKRYVLKEIVKTLAHENRHAYQYAAAEAPKQFGLTDEDSENLEALKTNMTIYNIPLVDKVLTGNMNAYRDQPLEYGVRNFESLASTLLHRTTSA
jgi:hypothetical protein